MTRRFLAISISAVVLAILGSGCGRGPALVPVSGTLTLDGKPLGDVEVVFIPDPAKGLAGDNATGTTDAQGRFTLHTGRIGKAGAAPGIYRIVVTDLSGVADLTNPGEVAPGAGLGGAKPADPKRPRVPLSYADAARTPLKEIEVKEGSPPLNLDLKAATR